MAKCSSAGQAPYGDLKAARAGLSQRNSLRVLLVNELAVGRGEFGVKSYGEAIQRPICRDGVHHDGVLIGIREIGLVGLVGLEHVVVDDIFSPVVRGT